MSLFLPETTVYSAPQISQDFFFSKVSQNKKMNLPPSGEIDSKPKQLRIFRYGTRDSYVTRCTVLRTVHVHSPDHLTILLRFGSMSQRTFHHSGGKIALYFHGNLKKKALKKKLMSMYFPMQDFCFLWMQCEWKCSTSWSHSFLPTGNTLLITMKSTVPWLSLIPPAQF